jgi:hypothetical protein
LLGFQAIRLSKRQRFEPEKPEIPCFQYRKLITPSRLVSDELLILLPWITGKLDNWQERIAGAFIKMVGQRKPVWAALPMLSFICCMKPGNFAC